MKQYKLYLFDFDYTLVNSEAAILKCFHVTLQKTGYPDVPDDKIRHTIGLSILEAAKIILNTEDDAEARAFLKQYSQAADRYMTAGTHFFPHSVEVLQTLKQRGAKLAIISNKTGFRIQEKFDRDNVPQLIDCIIGSKDIAKPKPDPEGALRAIATFDMKKENVLYIGDSVTDAKTAQNAGVNFAGVTTGTTSAATLAAYPHVAIMQDLTELL